jgi:hypothetical protein
MSIPINLHSGMYVACLYLLTELAKVYFCQESVTIDKKLKSKVAKLQPLDEDALLEACRLSKVFPHPEPPEETLHIFIRVPAVGTCSLFISTLTFIHQFLIQRCL